MITTTEKRRPGRPRRTGPPILSERDTRAIKLARSGLSPAEIADALDVKISVVSVLLSRARMNGYDIPCQKAGRKPTRAVIAPYTGTLIHTVADYNDIFGLPQRRRA